jgi:hypothetical protein
MKKKKNLPTLLTLLILILALAGLSGFYLWKHKFFGCQSPIQISSWKAALGRTNPDKSRLNLSKVISSENSSLFVGALHEGTSSAAIWHSKGEEIFQVLAGTAIIHSGKVENEKISWFDDIKVNEGDAFLISSKVVIQIEAGKEHPLIFSLFSPDSHLRDDRYFTEDYDAQKSACK